MSAVVIKEVGRYNVWLIEGKYSVYDEDTWIASTSTEALALQILGLFYEPDEPWIPSPEQVEEMRKP